MAGIQGSQSAEILLEVLPRDCSTAATYRLVPAWKCCYDGGRAAVPSTEATVSATLAAPAVPTPTAPLIASILLLVTYAGNTCSISLVPEGDSTEEASLAGGNCSVTLQIYPCEDRAALRVFELRGSQKKWRSTGLFAMCKVAADELQLCSTEQIFGKAVRSFHVKKCEDLTFPPFKLNFAHDFQVLKKLGQGTEGIVSKCLSKFGDFECAVKKVVPSNFLFGTTTTKHEPSEVTVMVKLNHPNVSKMFLSWNGSGTDSLGRSSDATFISMMLSARTLSCYLDQNPTVELNTINNMFLQIMMGLEYIHKHNVVHHDLKPGNILMNDDLSLRISDYGIAAIKDSPNAQIQGGVIGSFPYVTPEVNDGHNCTMRRPTSFLLGSYTLRCAPRTQEKEKLRTSVGLSETQYGHGSPGLSLILMQL